MTPDLAMIYLFAGNFAPHGYAMCNGQLLLISQNAALFSLMGTSYGGDGVSNFGLPDLQGRVPIHAGQGAGLSPYFVGQNGGTETKTLNYGQIPGHTHTFNVNNAAGTTATPSGTTYLAAGPVTGSGPNASSLKTYTSVSSNTALGTSTIGSAGGGQPFSILQPFLTVTYVIALQGVFPSRN
jgi:microcystin-dependent protein